MSTKVASELNAGLLQPEPINRQLERDVYESLDEPQSHGGQSFGVGAFVALAAAVGCLGSVSALAVTGFPVAPTHKEIPQPSWAELESEMVNYVLSQSSLLSTIKGTDLMLNPLLASTFTFLETDDASSVARALLPPVIHDWERVHWTLAYSSFLNYHSLAEYYEQVQGLTLKRYNQWIENAKFVYRHNRDSFAHGGSAWGFELEMNGMSDQSVEELRAEGLFRPRPLVTQTDGEVSAWSDWFEHRNVPKALDWRQKGCVQAVKNQAKCGSCWAFSAVEALESSVCVARSSAPHLMQGPVSPLNDPRSYKTPYSVSELMPNLSEQELVDCAGSTGNHGCNGGLMEMAFQYVQNKESGQLCSEAEYSYKATEGDCAAVNCVHDESWRVTGWHKVPKFSKGALKQAIYQHGAVSVSVEADSRMFRLYKRGVLHDVKAGLRSAGEEGACGNLLNHGIAAVGYGDDAETGEPYWIVKNSWGPAWGEDGFARLARDFGGRSGECGILLDASFPVVTIL